MTTTNSSTTDQILQQILGTLVTMQEQINGMQGQMVTMQEQLSAINERLDDMQPKVDRIPHIEHRLDSVENKVNLIEKVLTDNNKELRRHQRFIDYMRKAPGTAKSQA